MLGAAAINAGAIIEPCSTSPQVATIAALAARDRRRAEAHKREFKLQGCTVYDGYQDLLDNADVDAICVCMHWSHRLPHCKRSLARPASLSFFLSLREWPRNLCSSLSVPTTTCAQTCRRPTASITSGP